jgi:hypothetical protein
MNPEHTISAVIMVGGARGNTLPEQLMLDAHRACTIDLIRSLRAQGISPIIVATPEGEWIPPDLDIICDLDIPDMAFAFGRRLAELIDRYQLAATMYFGGGSAPLIDDGMLNMIAMLLDSAQFGTPGGRIPSHIALTNNKHSSDWLALSNARDALEIIEQADRDNSLAWQLDQTGEYDVRVIAGMRPATTLDLDTPSDLALVANHPEIRPELARVVDNELLHAVPIRSVTGIAGTPETNVTLMGRVSPLAWQALNKATQCWIRVFAEERGMVASGRLARGEVKTLAGALLRHQDAKGFFETLAQMTDAAIIDSRPLMASQGHWPSDADRFASDLFLVDQITNEWLREFTAAAKAAPIPILLGGHSVVAGGLYAMVEIIERANAK